MIEILPLCRKEKYFTSCILPQLICGDKMERLNTFLRFLKVNDNFIHEKYSTTNLLFYTEYSLKESADWDELKKHKSKETPDLVLLIKSKIDNSYCLIVIEAKMFNKTYPKKMKEQMESQKPIIKIIQNKLNINDKNVFHVCLLKECSPTMRSEIIERIILWNEIVELYVGLQENYFYKILKTAVESNIVINTKDCT